MLTLTRNQFYTIAVLGEYGSGKSLFLVELALTLASHRQLKIAANFYINPKFVRAYGRHFKLPHLSHVAIVHEPDITKLVSRQQTIILLDEAGIKAFSRDFSKIDKAFFENLFQMRKNGNILVLAAQDIDQIDQQLENRVEFFCKCESTQYWSKSKRRMVLFSRKVRGFTQGQWFKNQQDLRQYNALKTNFDNRFNNYDRPYLLLHWFRRLCGFFEFFLVAHKKAKAQRLNFLQFTNLLSRYWPQYWAKDWRPTKEDLLFRAYDSYSFVGQKSNQGRRRFLEFDPGWHPEQLPTVTPIFHQQTREQKMKAILAKKGNRKIPFLKTLSDPELDKIYSEICS